MEYNLYPKYSEKGNRVSVPVTVSTPSQRDAELQVVARTDGQSIIEEAYYDDDPNFEGDMEVFEEDSPYPEVRAAVSNADDPDMPAGTLRAWLIGIVWAMIIPGLNQFFNFRYPSVTIDPIIAQLISFPIGRAWAAFMPYKTVFGVQLNPGPFTIKEHVLITVMADIGSTPAYALELIVVQQVFYGQTYNFGFQWILVMTTQLLGFSIGGIVKRFLVDPPSMIWPSNLVVCTLFNTLHSQQYAGIGARAGMSRERFFMYVLIGSTIWYMVPGYLFTALSTFSWVCWIRPHDVVINQLFGYQSGLGMSLFTFDWAQITYIDSPLATPWWAEANMAAGFVFFFWVLTPILHYTDVWYSRSLPISSRDSYDNTGAVYDVKRILTEDGQFDAEKYKAYSPVFLSTTFAVAYGLSFASITAVIVHAFLYFRHQIVRQAKRSLSEQPDIHARLMLKYQQVPKYWYAAIFLTMFAGAVTGMQLLNHELHAPVWSFVLAIFISLVYVIPVGMIAAVTNLYVGLNVIAELIGGYLLSGRPMAVMLFKAWTYNTAQQALYFTYDLKLGHYMKIPPRPMFICQVVGTVIAGTVQLGVQQWMLSHIPDMCHPQQKDGFTCPGTRTFYSASVIWGVIGPKLQFSKGQIYYGLVFFFLIGAILPIIPWFLNKRYPSRPFRFVYVPLILATSEYIPPANGVNMISWVIFGFIFQYVIRRRHFGWWAKYNYVLSAALDAGVGVGTILIFFCLEYPKNGTIGLNTIQSWWGNTVYRKTADWDGLPLRQADQDHKFGPAVW